MSNETLNTSNSDKKSISYGAKLKAAREAMGLEQKDIAAQLRLGEKIIDMLESGHYSSEIPVTFIRGYIRSYSKLLQIPEAEVASALEPIKPAVPACEPTIAIKQPTDFINTQQFKRYSTYGVVGMLIAMMGIWWVSHTPSSNVTLAQNETITLPDTQKNLGNKQLAEASPGTPLSANPASSSSNTAASAAKSPAAEQPASKADSKPGPAKADDDNEDEGSSTD